MFYWHNAFAMQFVHVRIASIRARVNMELINGMTRNTWNGENIVVLWDETFDALNLFFLKQQSKQNKNRTHEFDVMLAFLQSKTQSFPYTCHVHTNIL